MPKPPFLYRILTIRTLDLTELGQQVKANEKERRLIFEQCSTLQARIVQVRNEMEIDDSPSTAESIDKIGDQIKEVLGDSLKRERSGNLSGVAEDFITMKAFHYFLQTGNVIPKSVLGGEFITDEEYISGACMGLCKDLARYGMGRAILGDIESIREARDLVSDLLEHLLKYDFQNGYLIRKFDDAQYALKTLETIIYEVNLTIAKVSEPLKKRSKLSSTLPSEELAIIFQRIERREDLRALLGKYSKEARKCAGKAIVSLHRDEPGKAFKYLNRCIDIIEKDMQPIIDEEPPLRTGDYTTTIEEYVEAKLFYAWLLGKEESPTDTSSAILNPTDFEIKDLGPEAYLCGLCNVTAEIARFAMQKKVERNFPALKSCLEVCAAISHAVLSTERIPTRTGLKVSQLRKVTAKLERMVYELSLSRSVGGSNIITEAPIITPDSLAPFLQIKPGSINSSSFSIVSAAPEAVPNIVKSRPGSSNVPSLRGIPGGCMPGKSGSSAEHAFGDHGSTDDNSSKSSDTDRPDPMTFSLDVKNQAGNVIETLPIKLSVRSSKSSKTSRTTFSLTASSKNDDS